MDIHGTSCLAQLPVALLPLILQHLSPRHLSAAACVLYRPSQRPPAWIWWSFLAAHVEPPSAALRSVNHWRSRCLAAAEAVLWSPAPTRTCTPARDAPQTWPAYAIVLHAWVTTWNRLHVSGERVDLGTVLVVGSPRCGKHSLADAMLGAAPRSYPVGDPTLPVPTLYECNKVHMGHPLRALQPQAMGTTVHRFDVLVLSHGHLSSLLDTDCGANVDPSLSALRRVRTVVILYSGLDRASLQCIDFYRTALRTLERRGVFGPHHAPPFALPHIVCTTKVDLLDLDPGPHMDPATEEEALAVVRHGTVPVTHLRTSSKSRLGIPALLAEALRCMSLWLTVSEEARRVPSLEPLLVESNEGEACVDANSRNKCILA